MKRVPQTRISGAMALSTASRAFGWRKIAATHVGRWIFARRPPTDRLQPLAIAD
jgi:hypothetical protein